MGPQHRIFAVLFGPQCVHCRRNPLLIGLYVPQHCSVARRRQRHRLFDARRVRSEPFEGAAETVNFGFGGEHLPLFSRCDALERLRLVGELPLSTLRRCERCRQRLDGRRVPLLLLGVLSVKSAGARGEGSLAGLCLLRANRPP